MCSRVLIALALAAAVLSVPAAADELRDGLMRGYSLLMDGDVQAALEAFERLEEAYPYSALLNYNLGFARYMRGDALAKQQNLEEAVPLLLGARSSFGQAEASDNEDLRRNAAFNAASVDMPLAEGYLKAYSDVMQSGTLDPSVGELYAGAVKGYQTAISAYEDFLRRYPGHEGAQQNLEYARYRLKDLLQHPPPEPPEQDQQEGEEGEDDQQEQEGEEQQEDQQGNQEQEEQEQEEQQQDQAGEDEQEEQQPQPEQDEQQQQQDGQEEESAEPNEMDEENRQTIEAILDSIEEQDRREQEVLRKGTGGQIRGDWW